MKIYEEILKQAGNSAQAAGLMHEHLWVALKSAADPSFHNVRIGRGDGGLDGLTLVDSLIGGLAVYQAKFFKDLSSTQHQDDVIDSFV